VNRPLTVDLDSSIAIILFALTDPNANFIGEDDLELATLVIEFLEGEGFELDYGSKRSPDRAKYLWSAAS